MIRSVCFILALSFVISNSNDASRASSKAATWAEFEEKPGDLETKPTILAVFLARNKAHALPYFLGYFERQDYPKDKISVWIHTDHNEDETDKLLAEWKDGVESLYQHVDLYSSMDVVYAESGVNDWPSERFEHLLKLKERALNVAKERRVDYVLYIDMDNIMVNPNTLSELIAQNRPVVAPMIDPPIRSSHSNFWCGVDERGYYKRTDDYFPTLYRERKGCFEVPMVHSTYLIDMHYPGSEKLTFIPDEDYDLMLDDLLVFAYQVRKAGLKMFVLNTDIFMRMPWTSNEYSSLKEEKDRTEAFFINELTEDGPVIRSKHIRYTRLAKTNFGFDKIYVINLPRRQSRRLRMISVLEDLGIEYDFADSVDGRNLTQNDLNDFGIRMLDGYSDPINDRPLTMGEIGCFLSHFKIWADVLSNNFEKVLVLEDDLHFEAYFRNRLDHLLNEVQQHNLNWDLIYLGRKRLEYVVESAVQGTETLVKPGYSYWTLAYMLSKTGARKLLQGRPLSKMMAVDEYLCIMFDQHPRDDWKAKFEHRNLQVYSAAPLLIYPTHYTKDFEYFSDTEASNVFTDHKVKDEL